MPALQFDTYRPEYAHAFEKLNLHWLEEYFVVEPYDQRVLGDPETHIIQPGGEILIAKLAQAIVGVVALMPHKPDIFELTKMAVEPASRGQKIGQKLLMYTLDFAHQKDLKTLILYSNRKLENAIYLYRKFGFQEVQLEPKTPYTRADIKMEIQL